VRCAGSVWDPRTGRMDPEGLRGADAVVHLAGEGVADQRWSAARKQAILTSRVGSTRVLVEAIAALPEDQRPRVLVAASAIGYYGDRGEQAVDESAPAGEGFLAEVCQAWEHEALQAEPLGVRTVLVRVGVVLGRYGGALEKMLPPFRLGVGGRLGSGRQWMSWIHLDDLVALFTHALQHADVRGVVNGVAPEPVTNATFTHELGRALHRPALLPVPAAVLRLALGEMSWILLASQRVLPRAVLQYGWAFRYPQLPAALADLCADPNHELEYEQWVNRGQEEVFAFFSDPYNLEKITPPFLNFRVLDTSTTALGEGTRMRYRLLLHGVPVGWQSRIDAWDPPRRFVDVQTKGPYACWEHTHEFEAHAGGTIVRDRVRYAVPLGVLGDVAAGWLVKRDLESIFEFRRQKMAELFGSV